MSNLLVTIDGHEYEVTCHLPSANEAGYQVEVNGETYQVQLPEIASGSQDFEWLVVDDQPYEVVIDPHFHWIKAFSGLHRLEVRDMDALVKRPRSGDGRVKAPIPGLVRQLHVWEGAAVQAGAPLLVLEAMKMENEIQAPLTGTVTAVHVTPGQTVAGQEVLVEIS